MSSDDDQALVNKILHASTSNEDILSDREIKRGRELLSGLEDDLHELNVGLTRPIGAERLPDVGTHPDEWNRGKDRIEKFLIALAPHRRLPGEILSEIFALSLTANPDGLVTIPVTPHDVPWVFGRVCSRWRQLSRSEYRLWGRAVIDMGMERRRKDLTAALAILPSTDFISVIYSGDRMSVTTEIIPNLWQIQELDLRLNITAYDELWRLVLPRHFATLQSAAFCIEGQYEVSEYWPSRWDGADPFKLARSLRKLKLSSPGHSSAALISLKFPWNQFKSVNLISLQGITLRHAQQILSKCSSLEELSVKSHKNDAPFFSTYRQDILPSLRTLVITHNIPTIIGQMTCALWTQLSSLDLEQADFHLDGRVLYNILRQCNFLTNLAASVPPKGVAGMNSGDLPLPQLVSLTLTSIQDTWIFTSLVTPMLTTLSISLKFPLDLSPVRHMLLSSECCLSSFTFIGSLGWGDTRPTGLFDLLAAVPTVRNYSCYMTFTEDDILQGIGEGTILPQLEALYCWPESLDEFVDMAEIRVASDHQRKRLTLRQLEGCWVGPIHGTPVIKEAVESRMEALQMRYRLCFCLESDALQTHHLS